MDRITQEVDLLFSVTHPNIVDIKDWATDKNSVYLFMTRVKGGELFDRILEEDGLQESEAKFIFYQILLATKYLHSRNICHRDIKAENVLLQSKKPFSLALLADFGLSKRADDMKTKCGTANYLAPEVMESGKYTTQVIID
jgi:serine/threonine-protein kinase Chk2